MAHFPKMFSRSYPLDARKLERDHSFNANVDESIPAPFGTERFTSECIEEALAADGRPMSGLCQMVEIRDFLNQLHMDCQAKAQEISVAAKIRNDLTEEVNTLRINTRQMRKQVTNLIEQARKACQQYRIEEQIRSHVEALTHNRARMEIEAHKLQRRNASLVRERNDYVAEQVHLQKVITTYRKAGALTSPSDASDDD